VTRTFCDGTFSDGSFSNGTFSDGFFSDGSVHVVCTVHVFLCEFYTNFPLTL